METQFSPSFGSLAKSQFSWTARPLANATFLAGKAIPRALTMTLALAPRLGDSDIVLTI